LSLIVWQGAVIVGQVVVIVGQALRKTLAPKRAEVADPRAVTLRQAVNTQGRAKGAQEGRQRGAQAAPGGRGGADRDVKAMRRLGVASSRNKGDGLGP